MKQIIPLVIAAACGLSLSAQSFSDSFYDALNSDNLAQQRSILAQWSESSPDDIDLHIARFNHYINRCMSTADNPAAADALADSGLAVIDRAINLFPDRLDLRFGKIFFLGEIRQWQPFADEIITTLNRSESIGHRWQYPNFDQGGRQLIIEGVQDYLYTLYEASQAAPADGSPAAQASLTPAQTDVMPHIRRVALRAAQLFPAEPSFLSSLAYTYIAEADYPTALRHLNRAEQLAPNDPAILQQLVDIHTRMKNKKQANIYRTRLAEQTRP